ncbi:hypothetical protein CLORY_37780 [Clostridium oryzae]|uniref:Uncharacterized protein n=1 Tax=Clostridium oryzae TaxID=1450648 RepID=A0A1V4IDS1_9CLOT|nr:hypothetical protein CLORY_37780 [Clostridium oryzae]
MNSIIIFIKNLLKGRNMYSIFLVIVSWAYLFVIILFLFFQIILWIFRVKYDSKDFKNKVNSNDDECK